MGKLGFYFNSDACIGCHTCSVACKDKNDLGEGYLFRHVNTYGVGSYPDARAYHLSIACNHCENPACVMNCPTGAMYAAEDGTIQHDDEMCIGCQSCVNSCPYGEPVYLEDLNIVHKCDSCKPYRDQGMNPACVDACLMRCLEFGDLDELASKHGEGLVSEVAPLPSADETTPSLLVNPKPYATESDPLLVVI